MPRKVKRLGVWFGDEQVAVLEQRQWPEITCRYTDAAFDRWPRNKPGLSCALPVGIGRQDARAFCRGLLPEGQALEYMGREADLAVNDIFGLLGRYGRDVAGAFAISEDSPEAREPGVVPYRAGGLEQDVSDLPERPLGLHDDSELSLPGFQNKLLLVRLADGSWGRPVRGYPSTHILKTDDLRYPGLVDAEAACLNLARAARLTSITPELADLGRSRCLIVSRFDRRVDADGLSRRVHQEDACQAIGIDPADEKGKAKYEQHGGPTFKQVADILSTYAADPLGEFDKLTRAMTFTVLIGNADAHGKNVAFLHDPLGSTSLAPLYDTVPTALWPRFRTKGAMLISGDSHLARITIEQIVAEAVSWGHHPVRVADQVQETITAVVEAASSPGFHDQVRDFVVARAEQLQAATSTVAGG